MSQDNPATGVPRKKEWKRLFLRGLVLLLPTILTVLLLVKAYQFVDENLIQYVNSGIRGILDRSGFYRLFGPDVDYPGMVKYLLVAPLRWFFEYAFGFLLSIGLICLAGLAIGTLVGRRVWASLESRLTRIPLVRFVYPFIREMTDFMFAERKQAAFRAVVAIEYPRKGVWSIGFVTGQGIEALDRHAGETMSCIFLPASPTPMTGYLVFIPEKDVVRLDISVDDAFKLIMSGGVITPGSRKEPPSGEAPGGEAPSTGGRSQK